ncbi:MAG: hypothetical protein K6B65_04970 [Bacilli bacterium]|nr:hypothetical protein [Bacilli bacterium]
MKKTNLILLVAAGTVLASCGGSTITREQASENLAKSAKYVESEEFTSPTKCTMTSTMSGSEEKGTIELAYDLDNTYLRSVINTTEEKNYAWVYADGDKYVSAVSTDGTTGTYAYIEKSGAEEMIKEYTSELDLAELFKGLSESLSSAVETVESQEASASTSIPGYTIEKNEFKENYTSTGDGNLTMDISYEFKGTLELSALGVTTKTTTSLSMTLTASIDKYLPKSIKTSSSFSNGEGESAVSFNISSEETFNWGTCDNSKPDLSKFTQRDAE